MLRRIIFYLLLLNALCFAVFNLYRLYPEYLFSRGWIVTGTWLAPWEWEYHLFVGNEMARRREYDRAIIYYRQSLKFAPYLFVAANNIALAHVAMGRIELAEAIWWDVLKADPGNPDALRGVRGARTITKR